MPARRRARGDADRLKHGPPPDSQSAVGRRRSRQARLDETIDEIDRSSLEPGLPPVLRTPQGRYHYTHADRGEKIVQAWTSPPELAFLNRQPAPSAADIRGRGTVGGLGDV